MFWPTSTLPVKTVTAPSRSMWIHAASSFGRSRPARNRPDSCADGGSGAASQTMQAAAHDLQEVAPVRVEPVERRRLVLPELAVEIEGIGVRRHGAAHRARAFFRLRARLRGTAHGVEDSRIRAAAADVARHRAHDVVGVGLGFDRRRAAARDDHPGGAVAALKRLDLQERGLHGMEPAVLLEALDRDDLLARDLRDRRLARAHGGAIEEHRARAALALAATVLRARQIETVAQRREERLVGRGVEAAGRSVDVEQQRRHRGANCMPRERGRRIRGIRTAGAAAGVVFAALSAGGCALFSTPHRPLRLAAEPPRARAIETSVGALADPAVQAAVEESSVEIHPEFTLAFVEFDDQGRLWNRQQLALLERTLENGEFSARYLRRRGRGLRPRMAARLRRLRLQRHMLPLLPPADPDGLPGGGSDLGRPDPAQADRRNLRRLARAVVEGPADALALLLGAKARRRADRGERPDRAADADRAVRRARPTRTTRTFRGSSSSATASEAR